MRIERFPVERMTIEAFAEKHDLTMEVRERETDLASPMRYYAAFRGAEVKEGGCLRSAQGNGSTESEAIRDYVSAIRREVLVFNAGSPNRTEIKVPYLESYA